MNRVALVTGASRGIGKSIAELLGKSGFNVVVGCVKNVKLAEETAQIICDAGGRADIFRADVSKQGEVRAMFEFTRKNFGFVDTVVNNAGISRYALFTDEDETSFDDVIGVDLRGVFNVSRAYVPDMISNKFGRIINLSSMWGVTGASCEVLYSAAKAGVIGLTKALAKELGPSGITVNAIAPGVIKTDMLESVSPEAISALVEETPVGRIGFPSDVASAVRFLASEEASFITGEILNLSGGYIM